MVSRNLPPSNNPTTLLLILLMPLLLAGASAATVLHDGPPPEGRFFTTPEHVLSTTEYTEISHSPTFGQEGTDHYLLPMPEGAYSVRFTRAAVRSRLTGETADLLGPDSPFTDAQRQRFLDSLTVLELGTLRRLRVASIRLSREAPIRVDGEPWEIASYTIRLDHEPSDTGTSHGDTGFAEGPYRRFVDAVLTVPAGVDVFASDAAPSRTPAAWRAEPHLSPGLPWSRIPISEDGLYAIGADWLRGAGLDPAALRPDDLYLMRSGQQVPLHPQGPEGATFAEGAKAVFFGTGNPGRETVYRSHHLGRRPDGVEPLHFAAAEPHQGAQPPQLRVYTRSQTIREENILKTRMGEFLSVQELTWVWAELDSEEAARITFDLDALAPQTGQDVEMLFHLHEPDGGYPEHVRILAGGPRLPGQEAALDPATGIARAAWPSTSFTPADNTVTLRLAEAPGGEPLFLREAEVHYPSRLAPSGGLHVYTPAPGQTEDAVTASPSGWPPGDMLAVDVRDADSPRILASAGGSFLLRRLILPEPHRPGVWFATSEAIPAPPPPRNRPWEDWHRRDRSADIVLITHSRFREAAALLAADQRQAGHEALVVDVEALYENFSHGDLSTEAIRDFLRHAVHEWEGRRPFAAILVGESNADGRNVARQDIPNYMPIPVVGSTREDLGAQFSSDSVYSWLTPENELSDIIIARLSPATEEDAGNSVANIAAYRAAQDQEVPWGNRLVSIVDTGDFAPPMEEVEANSILPPVRNDFLYADDVAWEDNYYLPPELIQRREDSKVAPLLTAAIEEAFHEGTAVMTFFGHGAPNLWSNHRFWFGGGTPNSDILRLRNTGRLPFVTSFTCNNAVVDYPLQPWNVSIAEDFMRHEGSGAIACFMPSGPGYTSSHVIMAEGFFRAWSQLGVREQGLLGEFSRINHQVRRGFDDHTRMFLFLGDPTLRLPPLTGEGRVPEASVLDERLHALGRDVLIEEVTRLTGDGAGKPEWSVLLRNRSRSEREVTLRLDVLTPSGDVAARREQSLRVPAGGRVVAREEFDLPAPGVYTFRFELPHASGAGYSERLPSRLAERTISAGEGLSPALLSHTARVRPGVGGRVQLDMDVFNPLAESIQARATAVRLPDGRQLFRAESRVSAGRSAPLGRGLARDLLTEHNGAVRLRLEAWTDADPDSVHTAEATIASAADLFPSLVMDGLTVSPSPLSDGLTVFVEGVLRNDSAVRTAGPVVLGLYRMEDGANQRPLPDMTRLHPHREEPLNPGEKRPFRLRWDPVDNSGEQTIRAVADPGGRLALRDRELAEEHVHLSVRSKARLATGELLITPGERENSFVLTARVVNSGGTDARLVVAEFHYAQEQSPETRIGEVLLERVPAGSTETVEFVWEPTAAELASIMVPVQPSFNIALRGSLQRVSSVAD